MRFVQLVTAFLAIALLALAGCTPLGTTIHGQCPGPIAWALVAPGQAQPAGAPLGDVVIDYKTTADKQVAIQQGAFTLQSSSNSDVAGAARTSDLQGVLASLQTLRELGALFAAVEGHPSASGAPSSSGLTPEQMAMIEAILAKRAPMPAPASAPANAAVGG